MTDDTSPRPTLAEDVLRTHVGGAALPNWCRKCQSAFPCDAYRLARIVEEVKAKAETGDHADTCGAMLNEVYPCDCWKADALAIIEKGETT